ncbi:NAD-dependent epimerase/dehydratase family protein [Seohaeicola saemankumensis]|uniref:NAD-dependent epimerase/dehydratase family protein n=1 Tax=Seohaeicola saemankumensis TaxID=481181 RepID=A0ABW3TCW3_9RHOB
MTHQRHDAPVLVLGSTGQLGSLLRHHWRDRQNVVWQARRPGAVPALVWSAQDDLKDLTRRLPRARAVVALWGVVAGQADALAANRALALRAIEIARATGAGRVLHCSSAAVYRPGPDPLPETAIPAPVNAYGQAKLEMEQAIAAEQNRMAQGPQNIIMRIGNVIGADSLSRAMMQARRCGTAVTLDRFADGTGPRRSFLAGADLARCIARLVDGPVNILPPVINLAASSATAMADLVRHAGLEPDWRRAPATAVPLVELDTARLHQCIGQTEISADPLHLMSDWSPTCGWLR